MLMAYLLGSIHFFCEIGTAAGGFTPCKHFGNLLPWPSWMFCMWFITLSHLAVIMVKSPGLVDITAQYRWFIMERTHSRMGAKSFLFPAASIFFSRAEEYLKKEYDYKQIGPTPVCKLNTKSIKHNN